MSQPGPVSVEAEDRKSLASIVWIPAFAASMCCFPSVVWVFFAGSSAIVAADQLSNDLYYSWVRYALYAVSMGMVAAGLVIHFRNRGVCTLDQVRRERRRIVNTSLAVFTASVTLYMVWNYVILEIIGIALGLPWEHTAFWSN